MKKVMVFGAFDPLHAGHLDFFHQARQYGDYLIVVVARNKTIEKVKKKSPKFSEAERLMAVKKVSEIDLAILGGTSDYFQTIRENKPDVICIGYDQTSFTKNLPKLFPEIELITLKPFSPEIYKSSIIKKKLIEK
jgi:FAD synthetase